MSSPEALRDETHSKGQPKIFVTKCEHVPTKDIREFFAQFGTVKVLQMCRRRYADGRSFRLPYGFLEMSTDEETQRVVTEANGMKIGENEIVCEIARPREQSANRQHKAGKKAGKKEEAQAAETPVEPEPTKTATEPVSAQTAPATKAATKPRSTRKPRQPRVYQPCLLISDLPEDVSVSCICKLFQDVPLSYVSILHKPATSARVRLADPEGYAPYADVHELSCPSCEGKTFPVELLSYGKDNGKNHQGADQE